MLALEVATLPLSSRWTGTQLVCPATARRSSGAWMEGLGINIVRRLPDLKRQSCCHRRMVRRWPGAGHCGSHWPSVTVGRVVAARAEYQTWIEYNHLLSLCALVLEVGSQPRFFASAAASLFVRGGPGGLYLFSRALGPPLGSARWADGQKTTVAAGMVASHLAQPGAPMGALTAPWSTPKNAPRV